MGEAAREKAVSERDREAFAGADIPERRERGGVSTPCCSTSSGVGSGCPDDENDGAMGFAGSQESNNAPSSSKFMDINPSNPSSTAKARARHSSRARRGSTSMQSPRRIIRDTYCNTFVRIVHTLGQSICDIEAVQLAQNSSSHRH